MTTLHHHHHPSGEFTVTDLDTGRIKAEGSTLKCVHCQRTWAVEPGSGRMRGWCFRCGGPTCGAEGCEVCVPWERKMEIIERRARLRAAAALSLS